MCGSLPAGPVVAINPVYPALTVDLRLPVLVALFNPTSFCIHFTAWCAGIARRFDFPHRHRYHLLLGRGGGINGGILSAPYQNPSTPSPTTMVMYRPTVLASIFPALHLLASAQSPAWGQCGGASWGMSTSLMSRTQRRPKFNGRAIQLVPRPAHLGALVHTPMNTTPSACKPNRADRRASLGSDVR